MKYEFQIKELRIIPPDGGRFEIAVDGELIYSKLATHRHAEPGEVAGLVGKQLTTASRKTDGNG